MTHPPSLVAPERLPPPLPPPPLPLPLPLPPPPLPTLAQQARQARERAEALWRQEVQSQREQRRARERTLAAQETRRRPIAWLYALATLCQLACLWQCIQWIEGLRALSHADGFLLTALYTFGISVALWFILVLLAYIAALLCAASAMLTALASTAYFCERWLQWQCVCSMLCVSTAPAGTLVALYALARRGIRESRAAAAGAEAPGAAAARAETPPQATKTAS